MKEHIPFTVLSGAPLCWKGIACAFIILLCIGALGIGTGNEGGYDHSLDNIRDVENKVIWIFWSQGLDHLRELSESEEDAIYNGKYKTDYHCVKAWEMLNPDWDVRILDATEAAKLAPNYAMLSREQSGLINAVKLGNLLRLELLTLYGGVWSDTSNCPTRPLDSFYRELIHEGFFTPLIHFGPAFASGRSLEQHTGCDRWAHGNAEGSRSNENFFMIAARAHHPVFERWMHAYHRRLQEVTSSSPDLPYFVNQCTFTLLRIQDQEIEAIWRAYRRQIGIFGHWASLLNDGLCFGGTGGSEQIATDIDYVMNKCYFVKKQRKLLAAFVASSAYLDRLV